MERTSRKAVDAATASITGNVSHNFLTSYFPQNFFILHRLKVVFWATLEASPLPLETIEHFKSLVSFQPNYPFSSPGISLSSKSPLNRQIDLLPSWKP